MNWRALGTAIFAVTAVVSEPSNSHFAPVAERIYRREIAELMKHIK